MGKPFVRFCEGWRHNQCMAEILWHRRETRRQTENTNIMPIARKASFYSTKSHAALYVVVGPATPQDKVDRLLLSQASCCFEALVNAVHDRSGEVADHTMNAIRMNRGKIVTRDH